MAYMSSIERIGMEIGMKKGEELGEKIGLQKGLQQGRQEGRKEGREEGREEGLQEGRRVALAEILTLMLQRRLGELDASVSDRLAAADATQLAAWTENFVGAGSLGEVFDEI